MPPKGVPESLAKPGRLDLQAVGAGAVQTFSRGRRRAGPRIELPLDGGGAGPAALDGALGQEGNLAGGGEQAVFVIGLDGLAGGGQVVAVDEEVGLLLELGDEAVVGQEGHVEGRRLAEDRGLIRRGPWSP